jgi:pyochelin synthetase
VLAELDGLGVRLWVEDGRLRYRAPKGVMTPQRLAELREHRDALIVELRAAEAPTAVRHDAAARYESFPLTDVQTAYLLGRTGSYRYGGVGCHGYGELSFPGVDPERLDAAWRALVARHDMLRAVVFADGSQQVQVDPPGYRIEVCDVAPEEFRDAVERTRAELDHRVYAPGQWPLFDLRLTRAGDEALLHLSIDFLIADFVSIQLILQELEEAYADPAAVPADLDVTYRDVLLAQRAARDGLAARRDEAYWLDRVDALPDPPDLPVLAVERPPPRFHRRAGRLTVPRWAALRERAQRAGVTPTCVVLAAYAEVLRRWSGQPDFTLNVTVLNRPPVHPRVRQIVGDFTSVELLAVHGQPDEPFETRARAVQARLWEDLDHGRFSGIEVMRELRRRRSDGRALFPVVFTSSVGLGREQAPGPGGLARLVHGISQTPQVWLDCQVMEHADGLSFNWDHREGVFPAGTVEAMFDAFESLLGRLADGDDAWAARCPVPVPATQLARRPAPTAAAPVTHRLHEPVLARAGTQPDRPAVVTATRTISYAELAGVAEAVAAALDGWDCPPGALVAVEMDKGWEQVAAVLGILHKGCAYVPVDAGQPVARRDRILADVGARGILTQSWRAGDARRRGMPVIEVDTLTPAPPAPRPGGGPDDLAYVIYTSGSTGAPKGVMITHGAAANTIADINARFGVGPDDRVFGLASLGFDLSVYDVFGLLSAGGALVLPDADRRADPGHWAELMDAHGVTLWNSVPAQLEMLVAYLQSDPARALPALRLALVSGDWIPVTLPGAAWRELPDLRLVSLGGATEASIWSIWHPIETVDESAPSIPYGRPLAGQTVEVLDAGLQPVPDLVAGEIYIGGAGLSAGYRGDAQRTAERFITDPESGRRLYRTGDFGRYLPDGAIEFLGRQDSQVKIRGHRVELAEVEAALTAHPAVGAAAVVTAGERPDPVRLAAFVEPAARPTDADLVDAGELATVSVAEAAPLRATVPDAPMLAFARQLDDTGLAQMLVALRDCGLFATPADAHTVAEVLDRACVAPRHRRLVRRWLRALAAHGLLRHDPQSDAYAGAPPLTAADVAAGWRRIAELIPEAERRTELLTYFRTTADNLPALLRGELDPLALLFPEGRTEIHEVAYTAMFLSQYVNKLLTSAACHLARNREDDEPFRVLEIGSGVGGTSVELIPALAGYDVEYVFSDVSEFFLNNARRRFAEYPWIEYRRYDMNVDFRAQGLAPNRYELIVCANVLHYAKDVDAVLAQLRQMLRPGGWVLFIEATRDSHQIMTSMEFLFDEGSGEFTDVRRHEEQTFVTRTQWLDVLAASGADSVACLPERDAMTDQMGMHVFAARYKADRVPVGRRDLERHLIEQLPDHMLPGHLQVVDRLPLTDNGKVDRRTLRGWLPAAAGESAEDADEGPVGEVEERLAAVWGQLLGRASIGRHRNFFELGGDSLLAAQVTAELRQSVPEVADIGYDELLRLLLEYPTVAALAGQVGAARSAAAPVSASAAGSPLVVLADGDGPATVFVHDGTGGVEAYGVLHEALAGRPLAGLVVTTPEDYLATPAGSLVDRVAAGYTRAVRDAGHDRVRLVGWHCGGVLAAEVARQLTEVGVTVDRLVVIAAGPAPELGDELFAEYTFYREAGIDPTEVGFPAPWRPPPEELRRQPRAERLAALGGDAARAYELFAHTLRAAEAAELLPYVGDITLVQPRGGSPELVAYWQDACLGELEIVEVDGDYADCLAAASAVVAGEVAANALGPVG